MKTRRSFAEEFKSYIDSMIFSISRLNGTFESFKKLIQKYRVHIIAWSAFIFWETIVVGFALNNFGNFSNYAIHYSINIVLFYTHAFMLEKAMHDIKTAFWKVPILLFVSIATYVILVYYLDMFLVKYTTVFKVKELGPTLHIILTLLWRGLYFLFFSYGYYFLIRYMRERKEKERIDKQRFKMLLEKEQVEKELLISKNAFLRAQVNPHLLFNTLEFVFQKMRNYAPDDAQIMIQLSEIMRYASSTAHNDEHILLSEEMVQCDHLIRLHSLGHNKLYLDFACAPDVSRLTFIPLVLITILENMFKHGHLFNPDHRASLDVYLTNEYLYIESNNLQNPYVNYTGYGSGLENIKKRLQYAYLNNVQMQYRKDEDGYFRLQIKVKKTLLEIRKTGAFITSG